MLYYEKPRYAFFPVSSFKPQGWLLRQLRIEADGLTGHLDEFYPTIKDSRWVGGGHEMLICDGLPLWLNGFIPLTYLLGDDNLKARLKRYIDKLLELQAPDGWICPTPMNGTDSNEKRDHFDMLALFVMMRALTQLDDTQVQEYVYRALKNLFTWLDEHFLQRWAQMVWSEVVPSIYWMYEKRPELWLLQLSRKLRCQAFDYKTYYTDWAHTEPTPHGYWNLLSHTVNNVLALSAGPLCYLVSHDESDLCLADQMLEQQEKYHGMVTGHISGEECLAGNLPVQGTELCSVVEMMFSSYINFSITGDPKWMDLAESLAFNSFPATVSPDMWTHQYDQQVNQVQIQRYVAPDGGMINHPLFNSNNGEASLFGLEPHFPCCTMNMGQGWPKLVTHGMMQSENGIAVLSYVPNQLVTTIGSGQVTVCVRGDYPFKDTVEITVTVSEPLRFALELRVPGWTHSAVMNDTIPLKAGTMYVMDKEWSVEETLHLKFPMTAEWVARPNNMVALKRGPLVYSVKIQEKWVQVNKDVPGREYPHCDYEIYPERPWNYGVADTAVVFEEKKVGNMPFSPDQAPVVAKVKCQSIDWPLENGLVAAVPASRTPTSDSVIVEFIPYGCTNLRLTELPLLSET